MEIDILTLFPAMLDGFVAESMLGRAQKNGLLTIRVHQLRDWATDKWKITDDRPFGGGAGMVMKPEPLFAAIEDLRREETLTIFLTPDGEPLSTPLVKDLAPRPHLLLVSGHYEGIDQRVRDALIDREVSIGDYILTNGTLAAAVLTDAVARYIPGVLGEEKSLTQDSFSRTLLGFPQYTRPLEFRSMGVPEVLLTGHHERIEAWRHEQQLAKTAARRPDLLSSQHETPS